MKTLPSKYLGLPLTDKVKRKSTWEISISKLQEKVQRWTYRALKFAGRVILTKSIIQEIPTYMLSSFPTPMGVIEKIRNI
jgi:hypothetical protein